MRFAPNRGFMHPVLGQRDFVYPDGSFAVSMECQLDTSENAVIFHADFEINVDSIIELIDTRKAVCQIWLYCSSASYRDIFTSDKNSLYRVEGTLTLDRLRNSFELHPLIVTKEAIELSLAEADEIYGYGSIPIPAGSPIAVHRPGIVDINDDDRSTKAIFDLRRDDNLPTGAWEIQIDHNKPLIHLLANEETKIKFETIRKEPYGAVKTLFLSALVETLMYYLNHCSHESIHLGRETRSWMGVISQKLSENRIKTDNSNRDGPAYFVSINKESGLPTYRSALWVAQRLLGNPLFVSEMTLEERNNND